MENGNRGNPEEIEVWVMRHADQEDTDDGSYWEPNAPLSTMGINTAQRVRSTHLAGIKFAIYASSGFRRAKETLELCMNDGANEIRRGLEPVSPRAWNLLKKRDPKLADADIVEMYKNLAGAVILVAEAEHLLNCIKDIAARLDYGEKALVVSHEPLINAALNLAEKNDCSSKVDIKKGEIIIFRFDTLLNFLGAKHLPLP